MEEIVYNKRSAIVSVIFGRHVTVSIASLEVMVNSIKTMFPDLTVAQMLNLSFHQITANANYTGKWATSFHYELSGERMSELVSAVGEYVHVREVNGPFVVKH
jgi:hypothetical protein